MPFLVSELTVESVVQKLVDRALDYGLIGGVLLFLGWMMWRYVPKLIEAHLSWIELAKLAADKTANAVADQALCTEQIAGSTAALEKLNKSQAETLSAICDANKQRLDPKGNVGVYGDHIFSNVRTNEALHYLARAKLIETSNPEARELIQKAMDAVRKEGR